MEDDCMDETILPVDFKRHGQITDNEIFDIMVKDLPAGCRLTAVMDCCHSGTAMDLPFTLFGHGGWQCEDNPAHSEGVLLFVSLIRPSLTPNPSLPPKAMCCCFQVVKMKIALQMLQIVTGTQQVSPCRTSTRINLNLNFHFSGAMTTAFIDVIGQQTHQMSFAELIVNLNHKLQKRGFSQRWLELSLTLTLSLTPTLKRNMKSSLVKIANYLESTLILAYALMYEGRN